MSVRRVFPPVLCFSAGVQCLTETCLFQRFYTQPDSLFSVWPLFGSVVACILPRSTHLPRARPCAAVHTQLFLPTGGGHCYLPVLQRKKLSTKG